ncbi:MAG: Protein up-regulated by thyroid hormone-putative PQQ-dependent glucose dehydrogenase [Fibrobacteres bacterium]|nr:Protein up-regulated by thyroid hormone-putative PQQ-dependent glucose dehydrogenase [Fibrobacterota bacterium]
MNISMVGTALILLAGAAPAAAGTLPESIALKPYLKAAPVPFVDCMSFQEIPGKPGLYLVVQKNGALITYDPKTGNTAPWLKISVNTQYEEGVNAVAFHPDFEANGRYFILSNPKSNSTLPGLNYGHPGGYTEILEEYSADADHGKDSGKPPKPVGEFCCKDGPGHNGQFIRFGKDRMLYLTVGDGNSDGRETQTKRTFLGTVLRIDIDHADAGRNYAIPKDNPFFTDPDPKVKKEIWSYGFRQPYKLAVDALTGDLWVGNVGGWNEDHVSLIRKGANFGWPITESTVCFDNSRTMFDYTAPLAVCDRTGITPPTIPVPHSFPRGNVNTNCVMGPVIYRGNPASPLYGVVFYADHTAQKLFAARLDGDGKVIESKEYAKTPFQIIHLQEAGDGRILVSGLATSQFYYLDDPGLLMGSVPVRDSPMGMARPREADGNQDLYNVAGRRLIRLPNWSPRLPIH